MIRSIRVKGLLRRFCKLFKLVKPGLKKRLKPLKVSSSDFLNQVFQQFPFICIHLHLLDSVNLPPKKKQSRLPEIEQDVEQAPASNENKSKENQGLVRKHFLRNDIDQIISHAPCLEN